MERRSGFRTHGSSERMNGSDADVELSNSLWARQPFHHSVPRAGIRLDFRSSIVQYLNFATAKVSSRLRQRELNTELLRITNTSARGEFLSIPDQQTFAGQNRPRLY